MANNFLGLKINPQLLEVLHTHNITMEELFVILCYFVDGKRSLLLNYLRSRNSEQKVVYLQSLVRKQFLDVWTDDYDKLVNEFDLDGYSLSDYSMRICEEIVDRVGSIAGDIELFENVLSVVEDTELQRIVTKPIVQAVDDKVLDELDTARRAREEFDEFLRQFLEKFPKGVKNGGGKTIRSNPTDVKNKMISFMNKYKRYTDKQLILKAVDSFISRYRGDFTYCPTAEYLISKNGSSALATECEAVLSGAFQENNSGNSFNKSM